MKSFCNRFSKGILIETPNKLLVEGLQISVAYNNPPARHNKLITKNQNETKASNYLNLHD